MQLFKSIEYTWKAVKVVMGLGLVFALITAGLLLLQLRASTREVSASLIQTSKTTQETMVSVQNTLKDVKEMANATLFQAEEVLHHTDALLTTEKTAQDRQLKRLDETVTQLQSVLKDLDESQKQIARSATDSLNTLPGVTTQLQAALVETQITVRKTGEAVESLKVLEDSLQPTVQHINETTGNLDKMSTALNGVVQNATKPKPWYKTFIGYVWVPAKVIAIFSK